MPTLETVEGQVVAPVDAASVEAEFARAMASNGGEAEKAPPKRAKPAAEAEPATKRAKPRTTPKAEQARTSITPAVVLSDGDRAKGVQGLAQVGAGIALLFAKVTGKDAYKADAVTIASAAPEIADAAVQVAHADPKFAAALDKVCAAGPYAALITVAVSVGSQCARNHKPSLKLPGTVDPDKLLKAQNEAEQAQALKEAEMADA